MNKYRNEEMNEWKWINVWLWINKWKLMNKWKWINIGMKKWMNNNW